VLDPLAFGTVLPLSVERPMRIGYATGLFASQLGRSDHWLVQKT